MTINERVKALRKDKKLNQKEFAAALGITQSGVSYMEQNGSGVSDASIKAICSVYNVNEEWLRHGTGPMYDQSMAFSLDQFVKDRGASELEIEILKAYFELDPQIRRSVFEYAKSMFSTRAAPASADRPASAPASDAVEAAEAAYKKALHSAPATGSSASSITEKTEENGGSIKKASGK